MKSKIFNPTFLLLRCTDRIPVCTIHPGITLVLGRMHLRSNDEKGNRVHLGGITHPWLEVSSTDPSTTLWERWFLLGFCLFSLWVFLALVQLYRKTRSYMNELIILRKQNKVHRRRRVSTNLIYSLPVYPVSSRCCRTDGWHHTVGVWHHTKPEPWVHKYLAYVFIWCNLTFSTSVWIVTESPNDELWAQDPSSVNGKTQSQKRKYFTPIFTRMECPSNVPPSCLTLVKCYWINNYALIVIVPNSYPRDEFWEETSCTSASRTRSSS